MKKIVKICGVAIIIWTIINMSMLVINRTFANTEFIQTSFADFTDEEADKESNDAEAKQKQEIVKTATKSNNNYLKNLEVKGYTLTPEFSSQTMNYEINGNITLGTQIEIVSAAESDKATIQGDGKITVNSNNTNIQITVKAENGEERVYTIKVNTNDEEHMTNIIENETTDEFVDENDTIIVPEDVEAESSKTSHKNIIIIIAIIILIILIAIIIIKKNKGKKHNSKH